jgi:NodT family efflux transporter outer membrane factor (OMF) lipoprotein
MNSKLDSCNLMSLRVLVRIIVLLGLFVFFSGCKIGPDHHIIRTRMADSYTQISPEKGISEQACRGLEQCDWFAGMNDPILVQLVHEAVRNNYTLREAALRIMASRAQVGITNSQFYPDLNTDASFTHNIRNSSLSGSNQFDSWHLGTGISWELDVFGRLERLSEAAKAQMYADIELYRDTYIILLADIATRYVEVRAYQQQIAITKANLITRENTLALVRSKQVTGVINQLDASRAEGSYESACAELPTLEAGLRQTLNRLSVLVGRPPGYIDHMLNTIEPIPQAPESIMVGIPAELIRRRPDIRAMEQQIVAQNARIGAAMGDWYPRFTLDGSFGLDAAQFSQLFNSNAIVAGFGPRISWNILTFGRIKSNIQLQEYMHKELIASYQESVLRAAEEVDNALSSYAHERERSQHLTRAVNAYEQALRLSEERYQQGRDSLQPVLDSQRDKLVSEIQRAISQANKIKSLIQLYRALGGAWSPAAMPDMQPPDVNLAPVVEQVSVASPMMPVPVPTLRKHYTE